MCPHKCAGHAVALVDIGKGVIPAKAVAVHHGLHQAADIQKADLIFQEELHSFLVGTVGRAGAFRAAKSSSGTTPGTRFG